MDEYKNLAHKVHELLRLFGLKNLSDTVTRVHNCDLKKTPDFLQKFNQITGLSLTTVEAAVTQFKKMLDQCNINYLVSRDTKSTFFQLSKSNEKEFEIVPVHNHLFVRNNKPIEHLSDESADYTTNIEFFVPEHDGTDYMVTLPESPDLSTKNICFIVEDLGTTESLHAKGCEVANWKIYDGTHYYVFNNPPVDFKFSLDQTVGLVRIFAFNLKFVRPPEKWYQEGIVKINQIKYHWLPNKYCHQFTLPDTVKLHNLSILPRTSNTALDSIDYVELQYRENFVGCQTYDLDLLRAVTSCSLPSKIGDICLNLPISHSDAKNGISYVSLNGKCTLSIYTKNELPENSFSLILDTYEKDSFDASLNSYIRIKYPQHYLYQVSNDKSEMVDCTSLYYAVNTLHVNEEAARDHLQKLNLKASIVERLANCLIFKVDLHVSTLTIQNQPHCCFLYTGRSENRLQQLISKLAPTSVHSQYIDNPSVKNLQFFKVSEAPHRKLTCKSSEKDRNGNLEIICNARVTSHKVAIANEAFGQFRLLNPEHVKQVDFIVGGGRINTFDYRFTDFSKPIPLFKGFSDMVHGTDPVNNLFPSLKYHQLKIILTTFDLTNVDVDYELSVYDITGSPMYSIDSRDHMIQNPLEIATLQNKYICALFQCSDAVSLNQFELLTTKIRVWVESPDIIDSVFLSLYFNDEVFNLPLRHSKTDSNLWEYEPQLTDDTNYSNQLVNLSTAKALINVNCTSEANRNNQPYKIIVEQENFNILRLLSGMCGFAYGKRHEMAPIF